MLLARDTTAQHAIKGVQARDASGTLRTIAAAYARDASGLRTVFSSGGAVASPSRVFGSVNSKTSRPATTSIVSLAISGGAEPYSIVWTVDDSTWTATSPTSPTTAFRSPSIAPGDFVETTAYATVTDANGTVFTSNTVTASATNTGYAGA